MGKKIGFVRHGEPIQIQLEQGGLNPCLSETGIEQARKLGASGDLSGFKIIFASPARRAFQTALILQRHTGLEMEIINDLSFIRIDPDARRKARDAMEKAQSSWPQAWINPGLLGVETHNAFQKRVEETLQKIIRSTANDDVLIVAHGEIFWALRTIIHGISMRDAVEERIGYATLYIFEIKENI